MPSIPFRAVRRLPRRLSPLRIRRIFRAGLPPFAPRGSRHILIPRRSRLTDLIFFFSLLSLQKVSKGNSVPTALFMTDGKPVEITLTLTGKGLGADLWGISFPLS